MGQHWINDDFILSNIFVIIRDFMGRPYAINASVILNIPSFIPSPAPIHLPHPLYYSKMPILPRYIMCTY